MSNVFASEFWRSLYFVGMGGQATEADPNAMFGLFAGFATFAGTLRSEAIATQPARRGGKDDSKRRPIVPQYVEWTKEREQAIARHETALFAELLGKEPDPLPIAEKKGLDYEAELNRINDLLLKAMAASADDARRKQEQALKSAAKKAKVVPPDNAAETRAMVVWLAKRAEWLREQEASDEEDIEILLLAA
jgi:hypothetical protein